MPSCPCIYGLIDPLEPDNIRYVGKTVNRVNRFWNHRFDAQNSAHPTYRDNWIRSLLSAGRSFGVVILEEFAENTPEKVLYDAEIRYIAKIRLEGHQLTNLTDGGDGASSKSMRALWARSPERKEQQRIRQNRKRNRRGLISKWNNFGVAHRNEFTEAQDKANRARQRVEKLLERLPV